MLDAFAGPVTMVLEGQQHQPGCAAGSAHRLEKDLGLCGQGARIGIGVAVDDEDGLVDLVGEKGG